jgi:PTH1 family peptidyl-tRNA hydrolase
MALEFIIVGLGNPGSEYHRSPHNAGFEMAEKARARCKGPRFSRKGDADVSLCRWRGHSFLLLKPLTYMNRSGIEVARWLRKEGLPPDRMIVCYDDLDLPFGHIRLRRSGGAGGHHGMESIISDLGVREFPRIRLGISPDDVTRDEHVDYLLTPLSGEKLTLFEEAAELGGEAALDAVAMGFARAMNSYNRLAREKARGDKDRD